MADNSVSDKGDLLVFFSSFPIAGLFAFVYQYDTSHQISAYILVGAASIVANNIFSLIISYINNQKFIASGGSYLAIFINNLPFVVLFFFDFVIITLIISRGRIPFLY